MIARWERQLGATATVSKEAQTQPQLRRSVADAGPLCLRDRLAPARLRADITELETVRGGTPSTGTWNEVLDRSRLPLPQSAFLAVGGGGWIQTDGVDFAGCADVPCVLNRIYGAPDGDAGHKLYWWFLRMGYVLSTDDEIPGVSGVDAVADRDFLFSSRELSAFWRLSWVLPESFRYMRALTTMHRFPPGTRAGDWSALTCADATHGTKNGGQIRLSDGCLRLRWRAEEDNTSLDAFLYDGVTHEMAHRLDDELAPHGQLVATSDEWLAISGWACESPVDPTNGRIGETCSPDASKEGFVRDYAATHPYEDWAETVAWVRFHPDEVKSVSPKKTAFIARLVYGGRTYDDAGLRSAYEDLAARKVSPQLLELVQTCVTGEAGSAAPSSAVAPSSHLAFDLPLPEGLVSCLERRLHEKVSEALDHLKATEWEACDKLRDREQELTTATFVRLNPEIRQLVGQQQALAPMLRASRALREALAAEVDPREAYLHCHRREDPPACYSQALGDAFDRTATPYLTDLGETQVRERESFLSANPFDRGRSRVHEAFSQLFAGVDPMVVRAATDRWAGCLSAPDPTDVGPPLATPFTGGTQFVASGVLGCVNSEAYGDLDRVRDRFLSRLRLSMTDPDAAALVRQMLLPRYLEALGDRLRADVGRESAELDGLKTARVPALALELTGSLAWLSGALDIAQASTRCQPQAESSFDRICNDLRPRFSALEVLRRQWSRQACERAVASDPVQRLIREAVEADRRASAALWPGAIQELVSFLPDKAAAVGLTCKSRHPGSRDVDRQRRRRCLTGTEAWAGLEAETVSAWLATPTGQRFAYRRADALLHLQSRRETLQRDAIRRMERP